MNIITAGIVRGAVNILVRRTLYALSRAHLGCVLETCRARPMDFLVRKTLYAVSTPPQRATIAGFPSVAQTDASKTTIQCSSSASRRSPPAPSFATVNRTSACSTYGNCSPWNRRHALI